MRPKITTPRDIGFKLILLLPLLVAALMWGEHERRRLMLIGTWQVFQSSVDESALSDHMYHMFRKDGTGEYIVEGKEGRLHAPFTYKFSGFSRLEITCDWTFYATVVVPLDDPRLVNPPPPERVQLYFIRTDLNRNCIYMNSGDAKHANVFWRRVTLKPLSAED